MPTKILLLDGLNDAKLCSLLEQLLTTVPGVSHAKIDFLSQRLTMDINGYDTSIITEEVIKTLKKNVPNVTVKFKDGGGNTPERAPVRTAAAESPVMFNDFDLDAVEEDWEAEDEPEELYELEAADADESESAKKRLSVFGNISEDLTLHIFEFLLSAGSFIISLLPIRRELAIFFLFLSVVLAVLSLLYPNTKQWHTKFGGPTLITIIVSIAATIFGQFKEAVFTLLIYQAGLLITSTLYEHFDARVDRLINIKQPQVTRLQNGIPELVPINLILPGDEISVPPETTIPFDGIVSDGTSIVTRFLAGADSDGEEVNPGGSVCCGDQNLTGSLQITVTGLQELSLAHKIKTFLSDRTSSSDALFATQRRETVFFLVELIFVMVASMFMLSFHPDNFRFFSFLGALLATCPCGLTIAAIASRIGTLGMAMHHSALITNQSALDTVASVDSVMTGLTGILTEGTYEVCDILPAENHSIEELVEVAASVESPCSHPIAKAILEDYTSRTGREVPALETAMFEAIDGYGVRAMCNHQITLIGSENMMLDAGIEIPLRETNLTCAYIAIRGEYAGVIVLDDPLKPQVESLGSALASAGIHKLGIVSGCDLPVLRSVGFEAGTNDVFSVQGASLREKTLATQILKEEPGFKVALFTSSDRIHLFKQPCAKFLMGSDALDTAFHVSDVVIPSGDPLLAVQTIRACKRVCQLLSIHLWGYFICKIGFLVGAAMNYIPFHGIALFNSLLMILFTLSAYFTVVRNRGWKKYAP